MKRAEEIIIDTELEEEKEARRWFKRNWHEEIATCLAYVFLCVCASHGAAVPAVILMGAMYWREQSIH